jgi:hypothetical protein
VATQSRVVLDKVGNATAIWTRSDGTNFIIQSASKPFGGSWSAVTDLSSTGQDAFSPQIALDFEGNAVAVWQRANVIQSATLLVGGTWSAPVDVSGSGSSSLQPQVAIDPEGTAIAVWVNSTTGTIQGAYLPFGGSWSLPFDLSASGEDLGEPQIAIDSQGFATVIWVRSNGTNIIVQETDKSLHGAWSAPIDLSAPGQDALIPQLDADVGGNVVVVWQRSNGTNTVIQVTLKPFGGVWSSPLDLSALGQDASQPQVKKGQTGTAVVTWQRSNGSNTIIQATTRPCCGIWSDVIDLSALGENAQSPQIAVNELSNAVVVWFRSNGTNDIAQASFGTIFPDVGSCE